MSDKAAGQRARYAANRERGLCGCGRKRRKGYKTCGRCAAAGKKVSRKYREYARKHGCTIAEAMLATRTRVWRKTQRRRQENGFRTRWMLDEVSEDLTLHVFVGGGWRPVFYVDKVFFRSAVNGNWEPTGGDWAVFDVASGEPIVGNGFRTRGEAKAFALDRLTVSE